MPMSNSLAAARSFLFVPGSRPDRFEKAIHSGADAIILDLEDGVPQQDKQLARDAIVRDLPGLLAHNVPVVVRVNPWSTNFGPEDLNWIAQLSGHAGVMLPKAESRTDVERLHAVVGTLPILPVIESAAGYTAVNDVATSSGVLRLVLGHIDFQVDTGIQCGEDEAEVAPLRFALTIASRLGQLAAPIDGVTVQIGDHEKLRRDAMRGLRYGFGGKICIHPSQMATVHDAYAPTAAELSWAQKVIAADRAAEGAAIQVDGRLIDLPIVLQARRTIARAAPSRA